MLVAKEERETKRLWAPIIIGFNLKTRHKVEEEEDERRQECFETEQFII